MKYHEVEQLLPKIKKSKVKLKEKVIQFVEFRKYYLNGGGDIVGGLQVMDGMIEEIELLL